MEIRVPYSIKFETTAAVPIAQLIESLQGVETLSREIGPLLEIAFPGLAVSNVRVVARRISQDSPLVDNLDIWLAIAYQKSLEPEVSSLIHDLFGVIVPEQWNAIVTVVFLIVLFRSATFISKTAEQRILKVPKIQKKYDLLLEDMASLIQRDKSSITESIEKRYKEFNSTGLLRSAVKFLSPSKNQNNAPLSINGNEIPHDIVAEFPNRAQIEVDEESIPSTTLNDAEIEFHAQDKDRRKRGWAAVVPKLSSRRIPMELVYPVTPDSLYNKSMVRGDILVEGRRNKDGDVVPVRIHLMKIY